MRHLVFTNTPAQVHVYKHVARRLRERGHDVLILARDYGCTTALLEYYDLPFETYGDHHGDADSRLGAFRALVGQGLSIPAAARRWDPDVVLGVGVYSGYAGAVTRSPTIMVRDSAPNSLLPALSGRLATTVVTPAVYRQHLGDSHYAFDGLKECAYLHPDVFERTVDVRERLGVGPDERFVLLRFNALDALHDVGASGVPVERRRELIDRLSDHARVFVSDEGGAMDVEDSPAETYDLHPAEVHDALAAADMLVADTGTMVTEAALLGTPALRVDAFESLSFGEFDLLESEGLAESIDDFDVLLDRASELLADPRTGERWARRRAAFWEERTNLADLLTDLATAPTARDRMDDLTRHVPGGVLDNPESQP